MQRFVMVKWRYVSAVDYGSMLEWTLRKDRGEHGHWESSEVAAGDYRGLLAVAKLMGFTVPKWSSVKAMWQDAWTSGEWSYRIEEEQPPVEHNFWTQKRIEEGIANERAILAWAPSTAGCEAADGDRAISNRELCKVWGQGLG